MGKATSSAQKDAALNHVKNRVERLALCSAEPADYAGVAAVTLADVAFGSADVTGPVDQGTARRATYAAKTGIAVDTTGEANHVALVRDAGGDTELLLVTTISNPQTVTQGNTADTAAFTHDVNQPT